MSDSGTASGAPDAPPLRGSIARTPLPQILRQIFVEQLRGTLTLSRESDVRRLYFEKGELRTATSSREGQRIGAFLRRRGRASDEDIAWALNEIARQKGSRLGQKLMERGLLTRAVIDSEMKRLVEEIVFSAFEWEDGEFRFEHSTAVLDPDIVLSFSTAAVIVEGIRRLPEAPIFRERLGDGSRVLRLASDPMSRYQYLPLAPQEAYVLSRIDGLLDVNSLLAIAGASRASAAKTLYALLSCGLVEWKTDGAGERASVGTVATLNVEVTNEPPRSTPGHADLVRSTWRRIDWLSHYELLGIGHDATTEDVRRAYLERGRLFHPDLRLRPDLAGMERELTTVFERLKIAHDTLSNADARAEYDRLSEETASTVYPEEKVVDPEARSQHAVRNFVYAMKLIDAKDYFPAVELLQEAVRLAPEQAEYRFRLGEVELKNPKWLERGLDDLAEAIRLAPTRVDFLRGAARAFYAYGRKRDAEAFARRAYDVEPDPETTALLLELTGQPATAAAPAPAGPAELGRKTGFLSRLLKKGR
jgi:curved DNA-binding protein CbpA